MALIKNDIIRLLGQLNQTGLTLTNQDLYQVIKGLINALNDINMAAGSISSSSSSGSNGKDGISRFLFNDSDNDNILIPGPVGINGTNGTNGRDGLTIPGLDGLDDDYIIVPGPIGLTGATGATGPAGSASISSIALSEAQIESWFTTPIQLIPAPAANQIIIVFRCDVQITVTAIYTSNPAISLFYGASTTPNLINSAIPTTLSVLGTSLRSSISGLTMTFASYTTFDPRAKAVNLQGASDPTGSGTGVATAVVNTSYVTITTT